MQFTLTVKIYNRHIVLALARIFGQIATFNRKITFFDESKGRYVLIRMYFYFMSHMVHIYSGFLAKSRFVYEYLFSADYWELTVGRTEKSW